MNPDKLSSQETSTSSIVNTAAPAAVKIFSLSADERQIKIAEIADEYRILGDERNNACYKISAAHTKFTQTWRSEEEIDAERRDPSTELGASIVELREIEDKITALTVRRSALD